MRIGYDLSERAASDSGASLDVRRMLGALGDCEEIDEVVVLAAFGGDKGVVQQRCYSHGSYASGHRSDVAACRRHGLKVDIAGESVAAAA